MNDETKETTYHWRDGMPTKPDVDALLKTWPEPEVGDMFDYETVATIIGCDPGTVRFKTVTDAWRRRLLEKGFVVECEPKQAFYVANADQITAGTYGALNFATRKVRKQRKKLVVAKIETDEQRNTVMHQGRLLSATERYLKKSKMNALPSTKADEQPRITPPSSNEQQA